MACIFNAPGCAGPGTPPNECDHCRELAKDDDLRAMATVFPVDEVRKLLAPRLASARRAPMPAVPIAPGKHVNRAQVASPTFEISSLSRSAGDQNCALCAAAGCVNLAVGYVKFTTKKVAKLHGVEDGYKAFGDRESQEEKIIRFTTSHLPGYQHFVHGTDKNRMDLQTALAKMQSYPDDTVFVVSTTGGISKAGVELSKTSWGHWLNAVKKNGSIMFVDFQTDHEQRLGRGFVSSEPILGNFGVEWDKPRMQVIAYVPPATPSVLSSGASSPRHSGSHSAASAAAMPVPVLPGTSTQQVVPLVATPSGPPTNRQLRGRAMNLGHGQDLDRKLRRQGGTFDHM